VAAVAQLPLEQTSPLQGLPVNFHLARQLRSAPEESTSSLYQQALEHHLLG